MEEGFRVCSSTSELPSHIYLHYPSSREVGEVSRIHFISSLLQNTGLGEMPKADVNSNASVWGHRRFSHPQYMYFFRSTKVCHAAVKIRTDVFYYRFRFLLPPM
uniref:Ovule protein n=1 Tax=Echinococcus granulosus TaxID=6210 RepID=A0A068WZ32_ECHGR|nr:hypothetical protein EgrG_002063000 [Echinococcus granulosus]